MKKFVLPTSLSCLLGLFFLLTSFRESNPSPLIQSANASFFSTTAKSNLVELSSAEATSQMLYDSLNLDNMGLSEEVLHKAIIGHEYLSGKGKLNRDNIIAVCDFSQPSNRKRLYIIDVKNVRVLMNTYVAHGKNTGLTSAEHFSNIPESLQSSLGFYVTKGTYSGKHGLSLRLEGLEKGFNDKAEERAIVMHGADYIGDHRVGAPYMGRSFGCPAVPQAQSEKIINILKNGTCLFIYHPTGKYLHGSKILNG